MRLKIIFLFALVLLSACTSKKDSTGSTAQNAAMRTNVGATNQAVLNIYCWSSYFAPELIQKFEAAYGVKVVLNFFSSNEELLAKLQAGARGYDLILPTSYMIKPLKELGLIQPLGKLSWKELDLLSKRFKAPAYDPKHEYTVPYAWGTTGIAVNREKTPDKVDSLSWLFEHSELKGQVTMLDDGPAVFGAALKFLGYSFNESGDEALAKAKELLMKQRKWLKSYTPEAIPVLESGEFTVAQAYSGDAIQVKMRKNPKVEYVMPKEGGEMYIDNFAIPVGAPSVELAQKFIWFTLNRENAATQVMHLFFSPVVDVTGMTQLKTLFGNHAVFPTDADLAKFETMQENGVRVEKIQRYWTEIKSM